MEPHPIWWLVALGLQSSDELQCRRHRVPEHVSPMADKLLPANRCLADD
jgi:hypothetical protein